MSSSIPKRIRLSQELQEQDEPEVNVILKLPSNTWSNKFNEMRMNNQLCDIKLVANNGDTFLAHKVLLAANSEYFNIMFNSGFKEATESEIRIQELDPHVLKLLIDFIYTSELIVNEQYVQEILNGICLLQFDDSIRNECVTFIKSNIYISNCLNMKEMADCLGLTEFYSYCLDFILENYTLVIENEEFVLISFDHILQIIKSNNLCCKEEVVYKSVMKWIKHDLENRLKHLPELLEYVRLPLVSPEFLKSIDADPLIKNIDCLKYLTEAYAVQAVKGTDLEASQSIRTQYRSNYSEYILIMSNSGKKHLPLLFNCVTDKWKTMPVILPNYSGGTIIMLEDGRVFDIGGLQSNPNLSDPHVQYVDNPFWDFEEDYQNVLEMNTASIYDFANNHWTDIAQMQAFHTNTNIVQIGCRVYVVGHYHCEYYNMELNRWFGMSRMLTQRANCEIIALNGLIYVIGGKVGRFEDNSVQIFDPKNNIWTYGTPMLYKRASPALCVYKDCIYAIGGWANPNIYLDKVEKYNPITETWVEIASLNQHRSKAGAVAMNGLIYVFGGVTSNYSIESYCPYRNKWSLLKSKVPNSLGCNSMCHAFVVNQAIQNKFLNSIDIM